MDINTINSLDELRTAMRNTEQTPGLSVLQHGEQVADYFQDLHHHIQDGTALRHDWKLPDWVYTPALWSRLLPLDTIARYQVYHDCGKPLCKTIDDEGKVHFPEHARVSHDLWLALTGEQTVARLMKKDMDVHLLKGADVDSFALQPEAATLLITGLCEVHANASMFGGTDSTSFKIKWKHLKRRGNAIVRHLTPKQKNH